MCVQDCASCWVRLGGSGPGSVALIRSATGQHCITPSMTKREKKKKHEKWRVRASWWELHIPRSLSTTVRGWKHEMGALCLTRKSFPELLFIICRELLSSYIVPVLTGEELVLLLVMGIPNAVHDKCITLGITIACPAEGICAAEIAPNA